jgi:hypothetical protein
MRLCSSIHSAVCLDYILACVKKTCLIAFGTSTSTGPHSFLPVWVMDGGYSCIEGICYLLVCLFNFLLHYIFNDVCEIIGLPVCAQNLTLKTLYKF